MLLLALAAQMSAPVTASGRDVRTIFSADDYPSYLQGSGVSRIVTASVTVRPDGTIQSCVAQVRSGDPRLDAYTCELIVRRAKFRPAKWSDGSAVYGVVNVPVGWTPGPVPRDKLVAATTPDLDLSVNRLPKPYSIVALNLEVEADEKGRLLTCAEAPPLDQDFDRRFPEFLKIACQQVTSQLTVRPPVDASGKAVRSVQTVSVHFKVDPSAEQQHHR